jgi:hypothetical protein
MDFTKMDFAKDLTRNMPSADDLIRAVGLSSRTHNGNDIVPSIALFGAGLLVGAGLALLFAPSSGRELREGLGERAAELRERAAGAVDTVAHQSEARPEHAA